MPILDQKTTPYSVCLLVRLCLVLFAVVEFSSLVVFAMLIPNFIHLQDTKHAYLVSLTNASIPSDFVFQ
jgi:hypothetical protein